MGDFIWVITRIALAKVDSNIRISSTVLYSQRYKNIDNNSKYSDGMYYVGVVNI